MCIGIMCAITLHNICIHVNDPCKRPWRLDVQDLSLIRGRHNGIHDKNEVRRVRQKVVDWLWSLSQTYQELSSAPRKEFETSMTDNTATLE